MSDCQPAFPAGISLSCMLDFINNVRQRKSVLEIVKQGLWISGCVVTAFEVVPSPVQLFMSVTVADTIEKQIEVRLQEMERIFTLADGAVAMGIDWMTILNLILKILELIPQRA